MVSATFDPHCGGTYKQTPIRLLVLSESHYYWTERPAKLAKVTTASVGEGGYRFHRAIRKVLNEGEDFWDRVSLYNYVHYFVR